MGSVRIRDLVDAAPLATAAVDADGRLVHVNRPYAELLGSEPADLVGRSTVDHLHLADADDVAAGERRVADGTADAVDRECRMIAADGRTLDVCLLIRPCRDPDGTIRLLETVVDRTPMQSAIEVARDSEARIRSAMLALADVREPRQVHDLILTMARSIMGARYAAMLVVEDGEPADRFLHQGIEPELVERMGPLPTGRGVLGLITADSGAVLLADLRAHADAVGVPPGHPVMTSFLGVPVVKDGELLARLYFANKEDRAEFDDADRDLAIALAAHAAGALVNARIHGRMASLVDELDRLNSELEEGARRRLQFLATVSHELRTPVHSILIAAELVSDPALGALDEDRMRELGAKIHASGKHLLGLIDDVVDLARLNSGKLELQPEPTSLQGLLRETIDAVGPVARGRDVELAATERAQARILVDPLRLRQVLLNLVTNAVKYTSSGGRVWVDTTVTGRDVRIAVHDTGVGIPAESLEAVFEPFAQLSAGSAGSGLGLAIARRLSELHGGTVDVSSTPGVGSTFVVSLPGVLIPPSRERSIRIMALPAAAPVDALPVLVVEDDHTARELVSHVLANAGYEVTQAASLTAAREALERSTPSLIVLDIGLGDGSGLDLARDVRAAGLDVPIAIVSANSSAADIAEAESIGCSDYLVKPVSARELLARIGRLVGASAQPATVESGIRPLS
jgi:PAS domain S-box-containing protein